MTNSLPGTNRGAKKGKPWMWSQWVWPSKMVARMGLGAWAMRSTPRGRAPVPQSKMKRWPAAVMASTQEVFPPKRRVFVPGVAIEPRVPQNRTRIGGGAPKLPVIHLDTAEILRQLRDLGPNQVRVLHLGCAFQGRADVGEHRKAIARSRAFHVGADGPNG